ncbi:hypothetical protein AB0L40_06115 [Patulibacter sp. NPDC049589]|uniref:hypothetical protein n=1 Tax=Patulibacter sp. NPDC049589 TaxID=3154731 RepID=UPI00341658C7
MPKTPAALAALALTVGAVVLTQAPAASADCAPGYVTTKTSCVKIPLPSGTDVTRSVAADVQPFLDAVGGQRFLHAGNRLVRIGSTAPGTYAVRVTASTTVPTLVFTADRVVTGTTSKSVGLRIKLTPEGRAYLRRRTAQKVRQVTLGIDVTYQAPTPPATAAGPGVAPAPVTTTVDVDLDLG